MAVSVSDLAAGDDLHQVGIGQQRRIFQDGSGDDAFSIARQRLHDIARHTVQRLDLFRQDGVHPDGSIAGEVFQGPAMVSAKTWPDSRLDSPGQQARDLRRQFGAHILLDIVGEHAIGGSGGGGIGGHHAARIALAPGRAR